ncbi:DHA2 family efflux MFS transporter permease subunit [Methylococcus sp. EFPC2]|uniref:DHA2 family efflux MFS transporter permease subunit n=1 Tax=Methylococcus sp. EFPC2 TaxID=2812648 RepID=UPI00196820BF|nr:DHA2 family efflux MFS transporter permease subunit [Methylococcus sp. EFPC2]QSA98908.1 DHA2 family efflux MFS transporter permease subunit [Methylococcus sp. EFPC2]
MTSADKNARAAWAPLTHDSLNKARNGASALTGVQFFLLNFGLLLGNLLVLFNTGAFASISLHATGDLGVSPSHASWLQSYYFVSLAISLPISAWLAARYGEVRLYLFSLLVIALGSLICASTGDLSAFVLGRVLQGFFGGLTLPLSQTLLMREYPESQKAYAVALWSLAALSPFTLGPYAGGWIADQWGWRWLFHLSIPLLLVSAGLGWALLIERTAERRSPPFDRVGFVLLVLALGCLQTVLNRGQDEDWYNSAPLVALACLGITALAGFIAWELGARTPLLDLRLFARRNFAVATLVLSLGFLFMYGLLSVLLVRLQAVSGYSSLLAGSVLLPLIFFAKPMAAFFHRYAQGRDARLLASLNLLAFAAYCYWTSRYDFFGRSSLFTNVLWSQVLEGFCLGGLFVPLTTLFLSGLTPRRQIQAVELGGMLRVLGGSVASPLLGVLWERRAAFHQSRLAEGLTAYDPLSGAMISTLHSAGLQDAQAVAGLAGVAGRHAAILGLDDTFRFCAWAFIALAALVWLAEPVGRPRRVKRGEATRGNALSSRMEAP